MSIDPMSGIAGAKELLDASTTLVELLKQIKGKLLGQPEPAARALATVLEEVSHTCEAIDLAIGQYLGVLFNPKQDLYDQWNTEARKELLKLDSVTLSAQVAAARTKSGKIGRIYDTYLNTWFKRVFGQGDFLWSEINMVWGHDQHIVSYLQDLVKWLSQEAHITLSLAEQGHFESANRRIIDTRKAIAPFRNKLKETLTELYNLQRDFNDAAGVLGF